MRLLFKLLAILALSVSLSGLALAQDVIPEYTVELTFEAITMPEEISAGIVTLNYSNQTEGMFGPAVFRLLDGASMDAIMQVDPRIGFGEMSNILGGVQVFPGTTAAVTYELTPGQYAVANFAGGPPLNTTFTVTEDISSAQAPEADVVVSLVDFAIVMPIRLQAGEQIWEVRNNGSQLYDLAVARIDSSMPVGDVYDLLFRAISGEDYSTLPVEIITYFSGQTPGERQWVTLNLEPGTYLLASMFVDLDLMIDEGVYHPHFQDGMAQIISVIE